MKLRLYRWLLLLLPRDFRREYGEEMLRIARTRWREAAARSPRSHTAAWLRQCCAVVRAAYSSRSGRYATSGARAPTDTRRPLPGRHRYAPDGRQAMDGWYQDLRYSIRSLRKRPDFTLVAVATLALGIGAATAIFSAVHAVVFRQLSYRDADRIVAVLQEDQATGHRGDGLSAINARDLMANAEHLAAVAVADPYSLDLQVAGRAESLRTWAVTQGFFEAAGAQPLLGRGFTADEYQLGSEPVALLGYRSWRTRFGADPDVVGSTLILDDSPVTMVGVLPPEFKLPDDKELWIPRPEQPWDGNQRAADYQFGIARIAPGSSLSEAQAEADSIAAGLAETFPRQMSGVGFRLVPLRQYLFGDVTTPLLVLLGAVGFVLLIACANVAGLMLARGSERVHEFALRSAIGASSGRLVRQVTVDSLILAALGCVVGVGIAVAGVHVIRGLSPDTLPHIEEIAVDRAVLAFAVIVAGLSAVVSGLVPSLRFSRPDLRASLHEGSRAAVGARNGRALRGSIVIVEVALAMVLLVGAGLLGRSFRALMERDLGFASERRLAVQVFAYGYGQDGQMSRDEFVSRAIEEVQALPGVVRAGIASSIPGASDDELAAIDVELSFTVLDRPPPPEGSEPLVQVTLVSENLFEVLGMPLQSGRTFSARDNADAPRAAVVNESFVRRYFPDEPPLGRKIVLPTGAQPLPHEIVGVVADVLPRGRESEPRPEVYLAYRQYVDTSFAGNLTFVLQTAGNPAQLSNAAKEAIWRVNPSQAVWGAMTLEDLLGHWLQQRRFMLALLGSFAVLALLLAGVGIYGLISFSVQQRVGEMGIRRALGGGAGTIVRLVMREALLLAGVGVALGGLGALALSRFIRRMLYGVAATDPATFASLGAAVLAVATLAALVPALRAMRVDPVVALRADP